MKTLLSITCAAIVFTYSLPSCAASITESFSGPTLDSSWSAYNSPPFSASTGANGLTIKYSGTNSVPAGSSGGVFSNFSVDGNYTMQVTQDISGMPVINSKYFVNGGPIVGPTTGSGFIGPYNTNSGPTVQGSVFENGVYIAGPNYNLSSQINTLEIKRVGDTLFEFVKPRDGSSWTPIFSATGPAFLGSTPISLDLFVQGTEPVPNSEVTYSNLSVTYGASEGATISGTPGGTAANPASLGGSNVEEITGAIGGSIPESFFRFHWKGGAFNSVANLIDADPLSAFKFELLGSVNSTVVLNQTDNFIGHIEFGDLAAGDYAIGLMSKNGADPTYYINFATPISSVPELSTWAMMLFGFAGLGFAGYRSSRKAARAI